MDTTPRGTYDSGEDFVLEYGELRFTFNERDFMERCEQAALKLGFVSGRLDEPELEDLVNLAVNGEINEPASALGEHVNDCWPELVGPSDRSLVHWLRRLVFRSAWLDQRVKEGELDVAYNARSQTFTYVQPDRGGQPVELAPEPSWGRVAYLPRCSRASARPCTIAPAPSSPTSRSGRSVPLRTRSSAGKRPAPVSAGSSVTSVVSPPTGSGAVAITVSEPPSTIARAAAIVRRATAGVSASSESISSTACPPRAAIRLAVSTARSIACACASAAVPACADAAGSTGPSCAHSAASSGRTPASTTVSSSSSRPASARAIRRTASLFPASDAPLVVTREPRA